jgi:prepilin-type N-terminal cleavage/methylation domain-containing protein
MVNKRERSTGFTLPELMISISIMAVVGLSTGAIARVLSGSYSQSQNHYSAIQNARTGMLRVASEVRKAKLVIAAQGSQLMLWQEPCGDDGYINVSELRCITSDGNHISVCRIVFPGWWPAFLREVMDSQLSLQPLLDNPAGWIDWIQSSPYAQKTALADDITSFDVAADTAAPMSTLVTVHVTAGHGASAHGLRSTVLLRDDKTGSVARVLGAYVLMGGQ